MKERCRAKRGSTAVTRHVCQLFQPFKESLKEFRVMELASDGRNVSCLALKVKDFRLQGGGDNDTHVSVCSDFGESISAGPGSQGSLTELCLARVKGSEEQT